MKTISHPASSLSDLAHGLEPLLAQYWWILFVRGALAVAFGLATLAWPGLSMAVLLTLVAGWLCADAVVGFAQAVTATRRWPHLLDGSLSLAAGLVAIFYPAMTGVALTLTIAGWLMAKGVAQALLAIRFGGTHAGAWLLGVLGTTMTGFGAFLAYDPADALSVITLIAVFVVLLGLSFVALGWWLER